MCLTTYTRTCNSPQSNDTNFQSPEQDRDFSSWFLQMSDSHCVPLLFTRSDVEMSGHQIGGQVSKNSQGACSLSCVLSLSLASALRISKNKQMGAGNAQPRISSRLAERKASLHSPDILILLHPARGEQRFSQLSAQGAVSQEHEREGNRVRELSTMFVER